MHPDARDDPHAEGVRATAFTTLCAARDLLLGIHQPEPVTPFGPVGRPSRPPRLGEFLAVFGQSA